ncbi:MAG: sialate O-acetylesterase [Williamsia sp.]|nr:sialate O-acetylesterase [Williamsia sp.]
MQLKTLFFLLLISCCLYGEAGAQSRPDSNFYVYLLMGQSNMAGRGAITEVYQNEQSPRVWMLNKEGAWVQARHPLHFDKPAVVGVGPGLAFGIKMAEAHPGANIGLVPCAVGGTAIERWEPGAYDASTNTHPYDDALLRIRAAMNKGVIKGVIWHQGESNASRPEGYMEKLIALIERVRKEVGNPSLPFVAGELGRYRPVYAPISAEILKLPGRVPATAVVTTEGLVHKGDTTHFDSPSATLLGERYAAQMLRLEQTGKSSSTQEGQHPAQGETVQMGIPQTNERHARKWPVSAAQ